MKSDKTTHLASLALDLASKFQAFHSPIGGKRQHRYPKELIESACVAYKSGVPRKDLVKITGVAWGGLQRWFKKSPASKKPRRLKVVAGFAEEKMSASCQQNILIRLKSGVVIELPDVDCLSVSFLKTLSVLEVA